MDDISLNEIRAARRELDGVISEIRAVPGYEGFLAAPTFLGVQDAVRGISVAPSARRSTRPASSWSPRGLGEAHHGDHPGI
jgi:hypothetical protein